MSTEWPSVSEGQKEKKTIEWIINRPRVAVIIKVTVQLQLPTFHITNFATSLALKGAIIVPNIMSQKQNKKLSWDDFERPWLSPKLQILS